MAVNLVNGDVVKIVTCAYTTEQIGLNTTYWKMSGSVGTGVDTAVMANNLDLLFAPLYKAAMTGIATWRGVGCQKFRPLPITLQDVSVTNTGIGTAGADALPTQSATVISFYATLARRSHRGRVYIPFPAKANVDTDGSPSAALLAALTALEIAYNAQQTIDDGAGNTMLADLCVWQHRIPADTSLPAVVPEEFNIVTRTKTQDRFATQRRRSQYGAHNEIPF